jgi:glycosyltransferase involved in cell wall biosynthesis
MPESVKPLVTVVIPCHNHVQWINDAIDSIKYQDYPHDKLRIVLVDDGSKDGSSDSVVKRLYRPRTGKAKGMVEEPDIVIGKLVNTDIELLLLRFTRGHGPSFSRNRGIEAHWHTSDFFAFLDSDDTYAPTKISRSIQEFLKVPEIVGVVYSDYDTVNSGGLRLRQWKEPFNRERLVRECIVNCDSVISKLAFAHCGTFDESMRVVEDYDLWLRISERFVLTHIAESLVTIRVGEHSSSSTVSKEVWNKCYAKAFEKAKRRISDSQVRS